MNQSPSVPCLAALVTRLLRCYFVSLFLSFPLLSSICPDVAANAEGLTQLLTGLIQPQGGLSEFQVILHSPDSASQRLNPVSRRSDQTSGRRGPAFRRSSLTQPQGDLDLLSRRPNQAFKRPNPVSKRPDPLSRRANTANGMLNPAFRRPTPASGRPNPATCIHNWKTQTEFLLCVLPDIVPYRVHCSATKKIRY